MDTMVAGAGIKIKHKPFTSKIGARFMVKRSVFIAFLLGIFLLINVSSGKVLKEDNGIGKASQLLPARTFNSELSLRISAMVPKDKADEKLWVSKNWSYKNIGSTPSDEPLQIPESLYWYIRPYESADSIEWDIMHELLKSEKVPGFIMPRNATDSHMMYLEDLIWLRWLHLSSANITDAGVEYLKDLKNLKSLSLSGQDITDEGLIHLRNLDSLKRIDLRNTNISDDGLKHLKGLKSLNSLNLTNTDITNEGLIHLKNLEDLKRLELNLTKITGDGLKHLSSLKNLEGLSLRNTNVTDEGLEHFEKLENLQFLHLQGTEVTEDGARKLKDRLPKLESVHLSD